MVTTGGVGYVLSVPLVQHALPHVVNHASRHFVDCSLRFSRAEIAWGAGVQKPLAVLVKGSIAGTAIAEIQKARAYRSSVLSISLKILIDLTLLKARTQWDNT